jgi:ABC-type methionine transport system ATPase subunit
MGDLVDGIAGLEPVEGADFTWSDITSRELWAARGSAAQYRLSRRVRLQVGLISATASLLQNQTLFDNIALPVRYHLSSPEATVVEAVNALMDALEIRELAGRRPAGLPRGARWKAELARALVLAPAVLIIESPLDGVDAESRGQILKLLRRRREEDGMAVVVAGPDVVPFLPVIDRALVLEGGRIIGAIPRASLEDPRIFSDRARLLGGLERSA